jgi:hypothetical protein
MLAPKHRLRGGFTWLNERALAVRPTSRRVSYSDSVLGSVFVVLPGDRTVANPEDPLDFLL